MEFITGLLAGAAIFMGYKLYQKPHVEKQELAETEKQKERQIKEHFDALMNYDVGTAYRGRK